MDEATFTIEDPDGNTDGVTIPARLVEIFSEEDDESEAQVVGDIALMAFAQRAHMLTHHSEDEPTQELQDVEEATLDQFEDRFGMTYGEATGHQH
jgi:antitoxin component of MazEF toxin-antitoxin module